jgi:glycosyltransferase involved in cell wall biosynthesis
MRPPVVPLVPVTAAYVSVRFVTGDHSEGRSRVGVLIVAYNAASTLSSVLDRLPASFRARVDHVLVCDDASQDATHLVALGYQTISDLPLTIIRHPQNLGYGGNQKAGYRWAIEHGLDVVVLLHGDGQYQPEVIETLVEPLEAGHCDAVFGSRLMVKGGARRGGMPMYKYVGNRILTKFENAMAGMELSEWHSGYRAYRVDALQDIDFESNSNDFDFDTEIILQLHEAGKVINEVPIPTYYGDEICHVNGMKYAKDVVVDVTRHRLREMGFGGGVQQDTSPYALKHDASTTHGRLLAWMKGRPPSKVLDLGCSDGSFGAALVAQGHTVVGIDVVKHDGVGERLNGFVEADLNNGVPVEVGSGFDVIVAADVVEHVVDPVRLLSEVRDRLSPRGVVLVSVPNFAHWYPRIRVGLGKFDYDRRGILDGGHLRFFTRQSFQRTAARAGLDVTRSTAVGLPFEVVERTGPAPRRATRIASTVDRTAVAAWPSMFAFQYLFELRPEGPSPTR